MSRAEEDQILLGEVRNAFSDIGYAEDLMRDDYPFARYSSASPVSPAIVEQIDLATFAQSQVSLRSACFGVAFAERNDADSVQKYRELGAAQILTLHRRENVFRRWLLRSNAAPDLKDTQPLDNIGTIIRENQAGWNPQSVLRAKTLAFASPLIQPELRRCGADYRARIRTAP